MPSIVERYPGRDREVFAIPSVGVVEQWREEPEEEHESSSDVCLSPPRTGKGTANVGDLSPVECNQAHAQSMLITEQLVDDDVFRRNPADPGKVTEGLEKVAREEVPAS